MSQNSFLSRHNGPSAGDIDAMLNATGVSSLDELIDKAVPKSIFLKESLKLPVGISEFEYSNRIREIASTGIFWTPLNWATCWI